MSPARSKREKKSALKDEIVTTQTRRSGRKEREVFREHYGAGEPLAGHEETKRKYQIWKAGLVSAVLPKKRDSEMSDGLKCGSTEETASQ